MTRAGVDIGTNTMRMLIVDDDGATVERRVEITGLGEGLDTTGSLQDGPVQRTLAALEAFGEAIGSHRCDHVRVVATAATREADNGGMFIDQVEEVLGHRPEIISGEIEARLAYRGATAALEAPQGVTIVVVDIGGGSTEFVEADAAVSYRIGSVRITDRHLRTRPAAFDQIDAAIRDIDTAIGSGAPTSPNPWMVGVAGTWTSLVGLLRGEYVVGAVHGSTIGRIHLDRLIAELAATSLEDTARLPGLHPKRARVILGGALIAREAMRRYAVPEVTVSESDLLDALVQPEQ